MSWPEVTKAAEENRYELVLSGTVFSERISSSGLDAGIFQLTKLNFLQISNTVLDALPNEFGSLPHLKTLDLHRNAIQSIPSSIGLLKELKTLDLSGNSLKTLPAELGEIESLHTLNLNCNSLVAVPSLEKAKHLARLDLSHNELKDLPDGIYKLEYLSELKACNNSIESLSEDVSNLQALKVLDLSNNNINAIPSSLANCFKLKDLNLKENRVKDNRLAKLINQCSVKAILDYVGSSKEKGKGKKVGKKGRMRNVSESERDQVMGPVIKVIHGERIQVVVMPGALEVRPFIVCTLVKNLDLSDQAKFRKFITIQTKIHESLCDQRTRATIATHNLSSLNLPLVYDVGNPEDIQLIPLGRHKTMSAKDLIAALKTEALKQKQQTKRNPSKSGLYKFLGLVEGSTSCSFLKDSSEKVISFPPVTNSECSKIKAEIADVLIEVTSSKDLSICKQVMDTLIQRMLDAGITSVKENCEDGATADPADLLLEQVRVTSSNGQLRVVYPSHVDLVTESLKVIHLE